MFVRKNKENLFQEIFTLKKGKIKEVSMILCENLKKKIETTFSVHF